MAAVKIVPSKDVVLMGPGGPGRGGPGGPGAPSGAFFGYGAAPAPARGGWYGYGGTRGGASGWHGYGMNMPNPTTFRGYGPPPGGPPPAAPIPGPNPSWYTPGYGYRAPGMMGHHGWFGRGRGFFGGFGFGGFGWFGRRSMFSMYNWPAHSSYAKKESTRVETTKSDYQDNYEHSPKPIGKIRSWFILHGRW